MCVILSEMSKHTFSSSSHPPVHKDEDRTDWDRVDAMHDEDIDISEHAETTPEMFAKAVARKGLNPTGRKEQVTLRIDADVLTWFRDQGKGYQSKINVLLRAYKDMHESGDK